MRAALLRALLLSTPFVPTLVVAQNQTPPPDNELKLGQVDFRTSCSPAAQEQFNRAVATLHSFWYDEAVKAFTSVTETDPGCTMGYWGLAMSYWYPLWYPPGEVALK